MVETQSKKQEILNAHLFRHACKVFDIGKKISDEDFRFILETGRLSPSSYGLEPWRFVVIQDAALREKLKPVTGGAQGQLPTASHFVVILARRGLRHDSAHLLKMFKDVHQLPDEVVERVRGFFQLFVETDLKNNERLMYEWASKQSYIALGNMMTAAAQIGIDSCPIEGFDQKRVVAILQEEGIFNADDFGATCMVAFGYRQDDPKHPKARQHLEEIVEWQ